MKLAEIIADGGVDDGLVIDDSLVKTQSYLVSGLFGPYCENQLSGPLCLTQCLDLKHQSNQIRFI